MTRSYTAEKLILSGDQLLLLSSLGTFPTTLNPPAEIQKSGCMLTSYDDQRALAEYWRDFSNFSPPSFISAQKKGRGSVVTLFMFIISRC